MKVVGLVSGGKDSLFSLAKCLQHGHEIVCVANLCPEQPEEEELDSFCFQTVGHTHIQAIADSLGVPLVKGTIKKDTSNVTSLEYPARPDDDSDEVERLFDLLVEVKARFPEVKAVSSGAILSNYQRLRVESVCARLGLFSLAYIWQRNQEEYCEELAEEGYEARLVKIASMGLKVRHLGQTLEELNSYLAGLDYCHSAGEGGEYETIVTDCPLFTKRLAMLNKQVIRMNDDDFAPVARIVFDLEPCEKEDVPADRLVPRTPDLPPQHQYSDAAAPSLPDSLRVAGKTWVSQSGLWTVLGGMTAPTGDRALSDATTSLVQTVPKLSDVAFVHVCGRSIATFAEVNKGYNPCFDANPPSRAFVEVSGQANDVTLDVLCYAGERSVLHVQSISEWAPACIGPYAQATTIGNTVLHAGMLGFDPPSMTLVGPVEKDRKAAVRLQAPRALESYKAVLPIVSSSLQGVGLGVAYVVGSEDIESAAAAWHTEFGESAPPCLVVTVSALPRHAAYELQLMSCKDGSRCDVKADGACALSLFDDMAFGLCKPEDVPACVGQLEEAGFETGHVKLFVRPEDNVELPAVSETIPVTVLPTAGYVRFCSF